MLRVFIDRAGLPTPGGGITLEDCERVTRQLQRVFEVEGVEYGRMEVSSPGLDRKLKTAVDFERFAGFEADVVDAPIGLTLLGAPGHGVEAAERHFDDHPA